MIKAKHTPGPWKIDYGYNRSINFIGPCVPDQYAGSSWLAVKEEDAILIAAAPDLLDALKGMLEVFGDEFGMGDSSVCDDARAAISKATRSKQ